MYVRKYIRRHGHTRVHVQSLFVWFVAYLVVINLDLD